MSHVKNVKKVITDDDYEGILQKETTQKYVKKKNVTKTEKKGGKKSISEDLNVLNNKRVSYIIKKYTDKTIISIYHSKNSKKSDLITTKWFENFYYENHSYLAELKKEKYQYIFIGGKDIYEFSLFTQDSFVSFNCYSENCYSENAYIVGKKYTYFLSEKCAMENSILEKFKDKKDPYKVLYDVGGEIKLDICDKTKYFMGKPL